MKKLLKSVFAIILVASFALAITGCTQNEQSKTYNALSILNGDNYILEMQVEDISTMTVAEKGENIYMNVKEEGTSFAAMYKDNTTYILSHEDKMCMTSEGKNEEIFQDTEMFSKEEIEKFKTAKYEKGKEEINGIEYEYEEYNSENAKDRYYFEGNDLKYIKTIQENGEESIMKILKMSSEVDDSVFEIPADYEKLEM